MSIKLRDRVVVITGASSGIGRAAARLFASQGATVVLAARGHQSLEEAAVECERLGGRALPIPTDVRDERAVSELARRAALRFGRIDVWVNCAAVMVYERFPEARWRRSTGSSRPTCSAMCTGPRRRCPISASRARAS